MKNIHILPTDKPSRLYLNTQKYIFENEYSLSTDECQNKNIYITSDEEIKDGDYFWKPDCNMIFKAEYTPHKGCQKVILTTDQDLIADGVQAIDDEFLEWFVKNPSCEWIELRSWDIDKVWDEKHTQFNPIYPLKTKYKIIIPKEEPKQYPKTFKELFANTGIEPTTDESGNMQYNFKATIKQETLEEVAENYSKNFNYAEDSSPQIDFVEGAKWQAERMYSEEEVIELLHSRMRYTLGEDYKEITTLEWFEQFKKK